MLCRLLLVSFAIAAGQSHDAVSENIPDCPDYQVTENITDPFIIQEVKSKIVHDFWENPLMRKCSPLVEKLKSVVLAMSKTDSLYYNDFAFQLALWSTSLLAEQEHLYPNFCPFARVVNQTVAWQKTGNKTKYVESIKETTKTVSYAFSFLKHGALTQLGCDKNPHPEKKPRNCYKNGLLDCHEDIWRLFGRLLPWTLRDIVYELTESTLFIDKAYATLISFILTPAQNAYFTTQSQSLLIESGYWFLNATKKLKCCCDRWTTKFDQLISIFNETACFNAGIEIKTLDDECNSDFEVTWIEGGGEQSTTDGCNCTDPTATIPDSIFSY